MSTAAFAPVPGRRSINHWVVALVVVVPTFMEILDTTIANVALRYIAGGLSTAQSDADWVITAYLAANAIVLCVKPGFVKTNLPAVIRGIDEAVRAIHVNRCGRSTQWAKETVPEQGRKPNS